MWEEPGEGYKAGIAKGAEGGMRSDAGKLLAPRG